MKSKFLFGCLFLAAMSLTSCSNNDIDEPQVQEEETIEGEAAKCDGKVKVKVYNADGSRASSSLLEENIDRFTATRVDVEDGTYTLVSYHGRPNPNNGNKREEIGLVQVINRNTNQVESEIFFEDARVNYCAFRNLGGQQTAYIGVDRGDKKVQGAFLCGIVCVPMKNGKFNINEETDLTPYKVEGVSVNCIKFIEQQQSSALVVASGGNNALGDDGLAGFTKFKIANDATKLLETGNNLLKSNFRGYWISHNIGSEGSVYLPVAYTYRTVEDGDLVWKLAVRINDNNKYKPIDNFFNPDKPFGEPDVEVEIMRKKSVTEDLGRFSVSMFVHKLGRFLVVSTGTKVLKEGEGEGGGTRVYRLDHNNGNPGLELVDVWDKACLNTSNKYDGEHIFASAAEGGVFKLKIDYYENGKMADGTTARRYVQLIPEVKRVTTVTTESGTLASTNYVQCNYNMDKVHVAGGYEGYFALDVNDASFIATEPRTDLVEY